MANFSIVKTVFCKKNFCALFTQIKFTFLKSDFETPFAVFEEKSFHLLEVTMNTFLELKSKKCKKRSIFRKTVFYKQVLDFHSPLKLLWFSSICVISRWQLPFEPRDIPRKIDELFPGAEKSPPMCGIFLLFSCPLHITCFTAMQAYCIHFPSGISFGDTKFLFFVQNHG